MTLRPIHPSTLGAPVRVLRVLQRRRTIVPVPLTYLMAAALGVAVGFLLQLLLGLSWWLIAVAVVASVWLLFTSSALWGHVSRGPGQELQTELLNAIDPAGRLERHTRSAERIFSSAPFRLYGLTPSWAGLRMIGGWESQDGRVVALELAHGDPLDNDGPELRVQTSPDPNHGDVRDLAFELRQEKARPPVDLPPGLVGAWMHERRQELRGRLDPRWDEAEIDVDGRPILFRLLTQEDRWVARADFDGLTVTLRGRRFPPARVELVAVPDLAPYIEGHRRHLDRARGLHGH